MVGVRGFKYSRWPPGPGSHHDLRVCGGILNPKLAVASSPHDWQDGHVSRTIPGARKNGGSAIHPLATFPNRPNAYGTVILRSHGARPLASIRTEADHGEGDVGQ